MSRNAHLDDFMAAFPHEALTFDDVTLITQYADFLPHETDLITRLAGDIQIHIPFVSAAMDTVTEADMAVAMAMHGGIGVIHKNLAPSRQAELVHAVKVHLNGLIMDPVTFRADQTLADVAELRRARGLSFNGFPILDDAGQLVGILTSRDIRFARRPHAPIREVMTSHVISAPPGTTLREADRIMREHRIGKLPLVEAGQLVGLYSYTDVHSLIENEQPLITRDAKYRLRAAAAVGPNDHERAEALIAEHVDVLVVDTAHGHSEGVMEMTRWIKKTQPSVAVIAGNIATAEAALALREAGADAVKVGIGPGSICTTRIVAGVGIPQLSAIYECAAALDGSIPVIADGGIRSSGDVAKAIAAGADSVMMGSALAGTSESPGEKILYQGRQYVVYRGMGSLDAMKNRAGSRERYGQSGAADADLVPQGIEGMVPYAGSVEQVLRLHAGGLRAGLGYCGCRTIADLQARARFKRISPAGVSEGHAHDITITKDAPNYRSRS
jgi:IMP dehydrogenase